MIKKVLSIDDDKITQMIIRLNLKNSWLCEELIEVNNGKEALALIAQIESIKNGLAEVPEVILLDLNMPIMGGWEFFDNFKMNYPRLINKIKIFILSSSISLEDKERAEREEHITAFIVKPLNKLNLSIIENSFN